jgi:hypothetical protein
MSYVHLAIRRKRKMTTKAELLKVIRNKCLDCCVFQPAEVKLCVSDDCPNFPFRMGKDPTPARGGRNPFKKET